jgi:beta-glucanase (GH16 family)
MRSTRQRFAFGCLLGASSISCSGSSTNPGNSTSGGVTDMSGSSATGGYTASSGGAVAAGGQTNKQGGASSIGGVSATGGISTNSAGGAGKGGSATTGGANAAGGTGKGGSATTGGTPPGGAAGKGGTATSGAAGKGGNATGGAAATGGVAGKGGNATGGTAATGGVAGGSSAPNCSGTGWTLMWSDEFNGASGSAVDRANWTFDLGNGSSGWGNSELEYYTDSTNNAAMDGTGNLVITARKEPMGGMVYTSARLKTQGLHSWTYGRIEGRMKLPGGQGIWPAFWMLGTDITTNGWPTCGEIDIMENIGKEPTIIHASLHGPGYSGGNPLTAQTTLSAAVGSAFHLFAVEWDATSVRWYVDSTLYSTKTTSDVPSGGTWVYTHPFFIILNVAVGGTWPGSPDGTTVFPQQTLVDYVRVCQK